MRRQGGGRIVNVVGNDGVNAVNPGPVETGLMRGLFEQVAKRRGLGVEEVVTAHVESIPLKLGRIADSREVTNVVLFLASDRTSFVNGVSINIDGGQMKPVLARLVYGKRR